MSKKITIELLKLKYEERGCELLETEYINAHTKMRYICKCGNVGFHNYNKFQKGKLCNECGYKKQTINIKIKYDDIYKYFKEKNCELLTKENDYKNTNSKVDYICSCGSNSSIRVSDFKRGQRCRECYLELNRGETHTSYNKDRTRRTRIKYLEFNIKNLHVLNEDPLYNAYIQSKNNAKNSNIMWDRSDYTVDHIFPRKAFIDNDLDNIHGPLVVKNICNLRENLRIIPREDNGKKSGKYDQEEFMGWFNGKLTD